MAHPQTDFASSVRAALESSGRASIRTVGQSMQPAISDGSVLDVRPAAFDEVDTGDLLVYQSGSVVYCHRLIRKSGRECILKGDGLLAADPPVKWSQVLGRVTTVFEHGERVVAMDSPEERRKARWLARMTYPHAFWHRFCRPLRRLFQREGRA